MLLDGENALFEPFNSVLYLTIRKLDEGARFSELFVQVGFFLGMAPAQMHLESFGDQLKLMSESFRKHASVASCFGNIYAK